MIDNDLKVHVLEVNGRPQLQSHVLDKAVNRPMLAEMLKIIGKVLLTKSCRETYDTGSPPLTRFSNNTVF